MLQTYIENMLERQKSVTKSYVRGKKTEDGNGLDKAKETQTFGHICRMEDRRLIKTVMLGMVNGNRPCGRPAKRWSDDIVDWCGCSLPEAVQLANDRQSSRRVTGLNGSHGP